jgi:peptidoglycan/xylan/chitin deacetylase (PgdA/CDA1 family)
LAEIAAGIDSVAEWTGQRPRAFAYPIGRPAHDYDARTVRCLRDAGIAVAFTTVPGWCSPRHAALEQPRFVMVDGLDGTELAYRLAWQWRT